MILNFAILGFGNTGSKISRAKLLRIEIHRSQLFQSFSIKRLLGSMPPKLQLATNIHVLFLVDLDFL